MVTNEVALDTFSTSLTSPCPRFRRKDIFSSRNLFVNSSLSFLEFGMCQARAEGFHQRHPERHLIECGRLHVLVETQKLQLYQLRYLIPRCLGLLRLALQIALLLAYPTLVWEAMASSYLSVLMVSWVVRCRNSYFAHSYFAHSFGEHKKCFLGEHVPRYVSNGVWGVFTTAPLRNDFSMTSQRFQFVPRQIR